MSTLHQNDKTLIITTALVLVGTLAYSVAYNTSLVLPAVIGTGLLALSWLLASSSHNGTASQIGLPALGMAMVGLLIHSAQGRTEAHFAIFAFLAVTVVYRHWLAVVSGATTIALHHLSFNYFQTWGWGPVCFTEPGLGHVLEHALYVGIESGVLIFLAYRARQDFGSALNLVDITDAMVQKDNKINLDVLTRYTEHDPSSVTGKLVNALQRIRQVVQQVHSSANLVDNTTREISSSNLDLSNRTEQAASHLQNTTAAMSDLDHIAQQTATSAHTADQLARNAADVAERGGQVVAEVVSTMNDIDSSSKKISDIVGVINGIALQTNILALNAAVEAARAGEQGKGFAIVAAEVRNLAQRSATAAHEIKELITNSVHKIESGTQLAAEAGMTMQDIVISVQKVSTLIGEISSAAEHQTGDIRKISSSVHALEQMTQQNAAMVEESAAAATSLSDESRQLVQALDLFAMSPAQASRGQAKAASNLRQTPVVNATASPSVTSKAKPMSPRPSAAPPPLKVPAPMASAPALPVHSPKPTATETAHESAEEWTTF